LGAWRDLGLFVGGKHKVPRLRRSSAARTIFFARDDRIEEVTT
jgi:hypothetical protein